MPNVKILVIDDEPGARDIIRYAIQQSFPSIAIDESDNGRQAKAFIENRIYDLVLCDWEIPYIKGDELLLLLRRQAAYDGTPFIMLSARNEKSYIMQALQLGANSYITKPINVAGLLQKVTAIIGHKIREFKRYPADTSVSFGFRNSEISGHLIDISSGGLFGTFRTKPAFPQILEKVSVNVGTGRGRQMSGIKGFIVRMEAAVAAEGSAAVGIAVKFFEISGENKREVIRHFAEE